MPHILKQNLSKTIPTLAMIILCLPFTCALAYTRTLSKKVLAVKPSRHSLVIFVPKICMDSQSSRPQHKYFTQLHTMGKSVISMVNQLPKVYDGLTLQNTIASRRICKAVANTTESKTHHPIFNSVVLTQKVLGGL